LAALARWSTAAGKLRMSDEVDGRELAEGVDVVGAEVLA
jgi:hypothetical protein